jgi:acyl carrier protein
LPAETHVEGSKPDRAAVVELVRNALAEILEVEPLQISEVSSFDDLGADSLALIELVEALEEELELMEILAEMVTEDGAAIFPEAFNIAVKRATEVCASEKPR